MFTSFGITTAMERGFHNKTCVAQAACFKEEQCVGYHHLPYKKGLGPIEFQMSHSAVHLQMSVFTSVCSHGLMSRCWQCCRYDAWFVGAWQWYRVSFPFAGPLLPFQYFV